MYLDLTGVLIAFVLLTAIAVFIAYKFFYLSWKKKFMEREKVWFVDCSSEDYCTEKELADAFLDGLKPFEKRFPHDCRDENFRTVVREFQLKDGALNKYQNYIAGLNLDSVGLKPPSQLMRIARVFRILRLKVIIIEEKYHDQVMKALKDAGALSLIFITTIAHAAMVALFIALTLPMLGVIKVMPSMGASCRQAIASLK